jgi:hypothetical protein
MQSSTAHTCTVFSRAIAITFTMLLAGCGSGELVAEVTPVPVPSNGVATVSMTAAPVGLSAVQVRIAGAGISAPVAGEGARILLESTVADTTLMVLSVIGAAPTTLLTFALANVEQPVTVVVQEATAGRNAGYLALKPADVTVSVAKR